MELVFHENIGILSHTRRLISRTIAEISRHSTSLSSNTFDQMADSHSSRYSMRIDDNIGNNPLARKGHIRLWNDQSNSSFLTRTRRHLVANRRNTDFAHPDFSNSLALFSLCHKGFIYYAQLALFRRFRCVFT